MGLQTPQEVLLPEALKAAAAGHQHTLCLSESGAVWCMGSNSFGQLGVGSTSHGSSIPRLVKALEGETFPASHYECTTLRSLLTTSDCEEGKT